MGAFCHLLETSIISLKNPNSLWKHICKDFICPFNLLLQETNDKSLKSYVCKQRHRGGVLKLFPHSSLISHLNNSKTWYMSWPVSGYMRSLIGVEGKRNEYTTIPWKRIKNQCQVREFNMQLWMWMRKIIESSESRMNGVVGATGAS